MTGTQLQAAAPGAGSPGAASPRRQGDAELARRIAAQDTAALSQVMTEQFSLVFALARRMVGNDADAEDIVQDVFMTLWRKPPDLSEGRAALSTWLYRVTSNRSIDWLRKKKPEPLEEVADEADESAGPEQTAASSQVARSVEHAIGCLPERQRLALVLTYYQGLTNIEAAEIMDSSVDALESLLARARRKLRGDLDGQWRELLDAISFAQD